MRGIKMPTISVIVPVYNNENFLEKSILSILNQTYKDFELILVDDGSTDSSGDICDEFAKQDARCNVIHQSNAGVSVARNAGIMVSQGAYIAFVDSDDWVEAEYLECLLRNMKPNGISVCGFVSDNASPIYSDKYEQLSPAEFQISVFSSAGIKGMIFGRLFDKKILTQNHIRFAEDIAICEDELFNINYSKYMTEGIVSKSLLYHYRTNPNGALKGRYGRKPARSCDFTEIDAIERARIYLVKNDNVYISWKNRRTKAAVSTLRTMISCDWSDKKQKMRLHRIVRGGGGGGSFSWMVPKTFQKK